MLETERVYRSRGIPFVRRDEPIDFDNGSFHSMGVTLGDFGLLRIIINANDDLITMPLAMARETAKNIIAPIGSILVELPPSDPRLENLHDVGIFVDRVPANSRNIPGVVRFPGNLGDVYTNLELDGDPNEHSIDQYWLIDNGFRLQLDGLSCLLFLPPEPNLIRQLRFFMLNPDLYENRFTKKS